MNFVQQLDILADTLYIEVCGIKRLQNLWELAFKSRFFQLYISEGTTSVRAKCLIQIFKC